ncbi:ATP-binding cassette domain-containing protein [bacterium]|nr:MAG: ATP-binding cassette domain-containing protein [bacterium]
MIELSGVEKRFATPSGEVAALRGVDLRIGSGEIFGIIGKSGAGKSTLVRCINLLERPSAGRVNVAGRELTTLGSGALLEARREIGMVFQHFNLLASRTAYRNVALPLELAGWRPRRIAERVLEVLEFVDLLEQRDRYPAQLSGGQKQRVGIARALAARPSVLLCDEATSALDPQTTASILALLKRINQAIGLTILVITHEMGVVASLCDRVAVIEDGLVVEQGPVAELFAQPRSATTRDFVTALEGMGSVTRTLRVAR